MVVAKGGGLRKKGDVGQRVQHFNYAEWISSGNLMYSMVTTVNNYMLYI